MPDHMLEDQRNLLEHLIDHGDDLELVMTTVPKLSTAALHEFFLSYNWDNGTEPLALAMDLPKIAVL